MSDMRRREFISLLGGAAAISVAGSLPLRAQPQPRVLRVGFVGAQPRESPFYGAFLERMAELGYQEGRNFTFEYIQTPNVEGYATSYREVAARKVDVFLAVGSEPALLAARSAAEGAPIAFLAIDFDPLAKGYVETLSRPGVGVICSVNRCRGFISVSRSFIPRKILRVYVDAADQGGINPLGPIKLGPKLVIRLPIDVSAWYTHSHIS